MSALKINKVGIIGSGTMGTGICQLVASHGIEVVLLDLKQDLADLSLQKIEKSLKKLEEKNRIKADEITGIVSRINTSGDYKDLHDTDIVIEAVIENIDVKKGVFKKIEENVGEDTIIATNTSTLPVTELASATKRPDKVLGIHFFNPVPIMKLVEIISSKKTSAETIKKAKEFVTGLGKEPVITKDRAGFIVNRILLPMINEAIFALDENLGSPEDIDMAMKLGANHPMGPLALADLIGLDVTLDVLNALYSELGDPKFRPAPLLKEMVRSGDLGRKTGKGFFEYKK